MRGPPRLFMPFVRSYLFTRGHTYVRGETREQKSESSTSILEYTTRVSMIFYYVRCEKEIFNFAPDSFSGVSNSNLVACLFDLED
jgi:hypothetical protein